MKLAPILFVTLAVAVFIQPVKLTARAVKHFSVTECYLQSQSREIDSDALGTDAAFIFEKVARIGRDAVPQVAVLIFKDEKLFDHAYFTNINFTQLPPPPDAPQTLVLYSSFDGKDRVRTGRKMIASFEIDITKKDEALILAILEDDTSQKRYVCPLRRNIAESDPKQRRYLNLANMK